MKFLLDILSDLLVLFGTGTDRCVEREKKRQAKRLLEDGRSLLENGAFDDALARRLDQLQTAGRYRVPDGSLFQTNHRCMLVRYGVL